MGYKGDTTTAKYETNLCPMSNNNIQQHSIVFMNAHKSFRCNVWVIWVSNLTNQAPQTICIADVINEEQDAVHLLCRM